MRLGVRVRVFRPANFRLWFFGVSALFLRNWSDCNISGGSGEAPSVQKLQQRIQALRDVAARTVPHEPKSKKKLPADITAALDAIVRLFYIESEASVNTNKAKRAIWAVLIPLMAPWAAETTVKTKMQTSNSRILGSYGIDKEKFCDMARVCGALPCFAALHMSTSCLS
jgi:hypothetical protein